MDSASSKSGVISAGGDVLQPSASKTPDSRNSQSKNDDSLEGLLSTLSSQMKSSDWLQKNTAEKWANENPGLAEEFKAAMKAGPDGEDSKQKST